MSLSMKILADQEALSTAERNKREDQKQIRPRVFEKIQNYFDGMLDGQISPILRLKINRSLCNLHCATLGRALHDSRFKKTHGSERSAPTNVVR